MKFDNTYIHLPERFYSSSIPATFPLSKLIAFNHELGLELDFDSNQYSENELAQIFSGQKSLEGSHFLSLAYAGHQFGNFSPSLGDGRAMLLGEVVSRDGHRYDLQLKGAGPTRFSRRGDGRSALGPVIREYIVSEAMHHLGVPTTRALVAVETGEKVTREEETPGGVFTRVASSHLRIGTFEYFAARKDVEAVEKLIDYSLKRHYPEESGENKALNLLRGVIRSQVHLVSKWMSIGFIHGVMNTDNVSISGETIDFGPCAFMDHFDPHQVYSYIDREGRYAYSNQPKILIWNLSRLADCLVPFVDPDEKRAIEILSAELSQAQSLFRERFHQRILKKLGINAIPSVQTEKLVNQWFEFLAQEKIDFTLGFRNLSHLEKGATNTSDHFYPETKSFHDFIKEWRPLLNDPQIMNQVNPLYIPRNHHVERAIQTALLGDYSVFKEMNELFKNPYEEQSGMERYSIPPLEEEKIKNTFCGT